MPFEGSGQAIFEDAKKIGVLTAYLEMIEDGQMSVGNACSSLHITIEDYNMVKDQVKILKKSVETMDYQKFMQFRSKYQSILSKIPGDKSLY